MKILVTLPHFFEQKNGSYGSSWQSREIRQTGLLRAIHSLLTFVKSNKKSIDIKTKTIVPCADGIIDEMAIVVCSVKEKNVFSTLAIKNKNVVFHEVDCDPRLLGFACQEILANNLNNFDLFCYLEDDLVIHDPLFFDKILWFISAAGEKNLLLPNRYEAPLQSQVPKLYIDGDINPEATQKFQDISENSTISGNVFGKKLVFSRQLNPHAGCFFLNKNQMHFWASQPYFKKIDCSFIGPLESAATLGVMRTFNIYKSSGENLSFLEIEHSANNFSHVFNLL